MAQSGYEMVRYADDFILLCENESQAQAALEKVREWVAKEGLTLHPEKTRIVEASQPGGFDFLGYHFERGMKWPRKKSMDRLQRHDSGEDPAQARDAAWRRICQDLNRTLARLV
jgi:RNA-directed DNA polymerase